MGKVFNEPKVGGTLDAIAPWAMLVGAIMCTVAFVLTFTTAGLVGRNVGGQIVDETRAKRFVIVTPHVQTPKKIAIYQRK